MYPVSTAYKEAMRAPFRQMRSRCRVYLGVFDSTVEGDGAVVAPEATFYADPDNLNTGDAVSATYATFEPDFFRLDGTQLLLSENAQAAVQQGWVSEAASDADGVFPEGVELVRQFENKHDVIGLTLTFGTVPEDAPKQFTLLAYAGDELLKEQSYEDPEFRYVAEFPVSGFDRLVIRYDASRAPYGRARMNRIEYGIGYTWQDDQLLSVTEKHADSPVSVELPTASMAITVRNTDGQFSATSDSSLVRFLSDGQPVQVDYGVDLEGGTEWIPGGKWYLSTWTATESQAKFAAEDRITRLTKTTFEKGVYDFGQHSMAELARTVLLDAGLTEDEFSIGSTLNRIFSTVPLPIASHAECLQLIANRARARLFMDRQGRVSLRQSNPSPSLKVSAQTANFVTYYSDPESAFGVKTPASVYATFEIDFFRLDGSVMLLPDGESKVENSGMTGNFLTLANGEIASSSETLRMEIEDPEGAFDAGSLTVDFGGQIPAAITVNCYRDEWLPPVPYYPTANVETFDISEQSITRLLLNIWRTQKENQRGHFSRVSLGVGTTFVLDKNQILRGRTEDITTRLRNVTGTWTYVSKFSGTEDEVASATIQTNSGMVRIEHDFTYQPHVVIEDTDVEVSETHYAYVSYISLTSDTDKAVDVKIVGEKMYSADYPMSYEVNDAGEDDPIENPLFDSSTSIEVLEWIGEYYRNRVKEKFKARGFPEVDCGDIITVDGRSVQIVETELTYNGAFNENFTVREG